MTNSEVAVLEDFKPKSEPLPAWQEKANWCQNYCNEHPEVGWYAVSKQLTAKFDSSLSREIIQKMLAHSRRDKGMPEMLRTLPAKVAKTKPNKVSSIDKAREARIKRLPHGEPGINRLDPLPRYEFIEQLLKRQKTLSSKAIQSKVKRRFGVKPHVVAIALIRSGVSPRAALERTRKQAHQKWLERSRHSPKSKPSLSKSLKPKDPSEFEPRISSGKLLSASPVIKKHEPASALSAPLMAVVNALEPLNNGVRERVIKAAKLVLGMEET